MTTPRLASLLPALMRLREYLEEGFAQAVRLQMRGGLSVENVTAFLAYKMADWDPKLSGIRVMDEDTRAAGARFLAGIATNFVSAADASTRRSA